MTRRIGIVGYGHLGQFLVEKILASHGDLELAFVWNRSPDKMEGLLDPDLILQDLAECPPRSPDLIVEVSHPAVVQQYGELFLRTADLMVGSPTCLADPEVEKRLVEAAAQKHGLYVPSGALWGGEDIRKMAEVSSLQGLTVTMRKHPTSFKLEDGETNRLNQTVSKDPVVLYEGPVRALCPQAPNNVNTMAAACVAASNLGFDKVIGKLVSDPSLLDWHVVEVEAFGRKPPNAGNQFRVKTERWNPADPGAVTGSATFNSFFASVRRAHGKGPGVHLC